MKKIYSFFSVFFAKHPMRACKCGPECPVELYALAFEHLKVARSFLLKCQRIGA